MANPKNAGDPGVFLFLGHTGVLPPFWFWFVLGYCADVIRRLAQWARSSYHSNTNDSHCDQPKCQDEPRKENTMAKTLSFGVMHMSIAFGIGYALTGDLLISGAITLIEPVANTIAFHFFDKFWGRQPRWLARWSKSKEHQPALSKA